MAPRDPPLAPVGRRLPLRSSAEQGRDDPLAPLAAPYVPPPGLVDTLSAIAGRRPKAILTEGREDFLQGDLGRYAAVARKGEPLQDTVFVTNAPDARQFFDPTLSPTATPEIANMTQRFGHPLSPDDVLAHEFGHVAIHSPYSDVPAGVWGITDNEEFADEFARALRNLRAGREVTPSRIPLRWMQGRAEAAYNPPNNPGRGAANSIRSLLGRRQVPSI